MYTSTLTCSTIVRTCRCEPFFPTLNIRRDSRAVVPPSGKLVLEDPRRLETEALQRYFKHGKKLSTFERQLYRFGFRKLTRTGKMEVSPPCIYMQLLEDDFFLYDYTVYCTFCT